MEDGSSAVYAISVAAEMAWMPIQNLRFYERRGLVSPARTAGGTRRYSRDDVELLQRIGSLLDEGLNLAGVAKVLALEEELSALRARLAATGVDHGIEPGRPGGPPGPVGSGGPPGR